MKKHEHLLEVMRECDYRVVEGPAVCGCSPPETRCLLGKGGWPRDPHLVNPNDCLNCTKGGENGRALAKDTPAPKRNDGAKDTDHGASVENRRNGTAIGQSLVPLSAESGIEREILRLERELQQLWFDVRNIQNYRGPAVEQGLASLFDTLGTGFGFPSTPTGFGCDGGMPLTLYWSDSVYPYDSSGNPITLTYNPSTGNYEGSFLGDSPAACGCSGDTNVPISISYSPSGVSMTYNGDGSCCPTSSSGSSCTNNFPPPSVFVCDLSDSSNFSTDMSSPSDGSGAGTNSCKLGYTPDDGTSFNGGPINASGCYIPRTLFWRDSSYGIWTLHYDSVNGWWRTTKNITAPACGSCSSVSVPVRVTFTSGGGGNIGVSGPYNYTTHCPDPSGTADQSYGLFSASPYTCPPFYFHGGMSSSPTCDPWSTVFGTETWSIKGAGTH